MANGEEALVGATGAEPVKSEDIEEDKGEGIYPDKGDHQGLRRDDLQYAKQKDRGRAHQQKALQQLEKYTESIPNGTTELSPDYDNIDNLDINEAEVSNQ